MKRVLIIAGLCLATAICYGQQEYENSKWHFSFTVPDDWEPVDYNDLTGKHIDIVKGYITPTSLFNMVTGIAKPPDALAIYQQIDAEQDHTAWLIVHARTVGDSTDAIPPESKHEDWLTSDWRRRSGIDALLRMQHELMKREKSKKKWTSGDKRSFYMDRKIHTLAEQLKISDPSGETFIFTKVTKLGSNRAVTLTFHAFNQDVDEFMDLMDELLDSFTYQEHYGFGETTATNVMKTIWAWVGSSVVAMIIICVIIHQRVS